MAYLQEPGTVNRVASRGVVGEGDVGQLEVTRVEAVSNGHSSPELRQETALLPPAVPIVAPGRGEKRAREAAAGEAVTEAASLPRGQRAGWAARLRVIPAGRLLRSAEWVAYCLVIAPLASFLPARIGYRIACWRGDWCFRYRTGKRSEIVRNLRAVLGGELGPEEAERHARELFRMTACEIVDMARLRGRARPLARLVEIRGREHLDAARAGGKGAIICSAHFGCCNSAFSLLHASGYPLTSVGRSPAKHAPGMSPVERRLWQFVYTRRLRRHRQRPIIEPLPGQVQVAVRAAVALRANELVTISSDAPPLDTDLARAVDVPFLGRQARLLPGVVTLAQLTGAPVLMMFIHRSPDYRHQVLEISPPVSLEGGTVTAFGRCAAAIDAAIRTNPGHWVYWAITDDLVSMGLLPAAPDH